MNVKKIYSEVEQTIPILNGLYTNWRHMLQNTNTSTNQEFQWTTDEIKKRITTIELDLQDLEETINILSYFIVLFFFSFVSIHVLFSFF